MLVGWPLKSVWRTPPLLRHEGSHAVGLEECVDAGRGSTIRGSGAIARLGDRLSK
jgi:hypothetical protein